MPAYPSTTTRRRTASRRSSWREPAVRRQRRYRDEIPVQRPLARPRPNLHFLTSRVLALLLAGIVAFGIGQLLANDHFYVYSIQVTGNRILSEGEVFEHSGIAGHNVFWVRPQQVVAMLSAHPYIKSARVQVGLPNRVRIDLVEREPQLVWDVNGTVAWIDDEGVVLPRLDGGGGLVTLLDPEGQAALDEGHLRPAIVMGLLEIHRLLPEVKVFQYSESLGLHFELPGGTICYMGDEMNMKEKVALLNALRQKLAADKVQAKLIDLRYQDRPYYR
ncbi:MAG: FtsQ-type POTRA domain-containing protein [Anaerolineae bacterium]|nr:FtsQ-type POTRA domain-containing protein [Anaerolineae bacterium]